MKYILIILALAIIGSPVAAQPTPPPIPGATATPMPTATPIPTPQPLKALMFTPNGQVVAATNLTWTNSVTFSQVTVTNTFYPPTFTSTNGFYGAGSLRMTGNATTTRLIYKLLGASPLDRTVLNAEDNLENLSNPSVARTNLGLGSGITTNRTFVATGVTNSVSISNGIITGWTQ